MAGDPAGALLLLGMGTGAFNKSSVEVPGVGSSRDAERRRSRLKILRGGTPLLGLFKRKAAITVRLPTIKRNALGIGPIRI